MGLLALLWGSTFLWIEVALGSGLSPSGIAFVRCLLGAGVLYVLSRSVGQRLPRDLVTWGRLTVAALFCNALPFLLFGIGQQTVDSGVAGVLNATTPLWSLLIGLAIGTERGLHPVRLGGLLLGFAGTVLIFAPWGRDGLVSRGALALLAAAASYAVAFAYMGRKLTVGGTAPLAVSAAQLLAAAGLSVPLLFVDGPVRARPDATALLAVVVLGVFCTGITFHLNHRLIADEGATGAATVGYLLPVVSVALGAAVLGEEIGPRVVAGMVVVLAGVAMTRRRGRPRPTAGRAGAPAAPEGRRERPDAVSRARSGS
ncbi:DMT family transporter [Streptomyces macrosporus]|uniref:DMT family transporter n=2 Tax=Streptomyces macrosporus TaxID=44032 RepID=A0ABN3JPZ8_9ACTN